MSTPHVGTWQLAWTRLAASNSVPARTQHTACYHPQSDVVLIFGGYSSTHGHLNDLWVLNLRAGELWQPRDHGHVPAQRRGHVAEIVGTSMWLFGGADDDGPLGDVYCLNLQDWQWKQVRLALQRDLL